MSNNNFVRLMLLECPSPLDVMRGRSEITVLAGMAKLIGHSVWSSTVLSKRALRDACSFIGSLTSVRDKQAETTLCLHISAHGNENGLLFGGDDLSWSELLDVIQPVLTASYKGRRVLVLSACDADQQKLTEVIKERVKANDELVPPHYVFCCTGEANWDDAALAWLMLYKKMPTLDFSEKGEVKKALQEIEQFDGTTLVYFRWESKRNTYCHYNP